MTSDAAADRTVRLLRNHGEETKSVHEVVGYCNRLHNLQAGFLLAKLAHLTQWNNARCAAALRYDDLLAAVSGATPLGCRDDVQHVYHLYVVQVEGRDTVRERLGAEGVQTGIHYPAPLHLQPAYKGLGYGPGDFPVAEAMAARILSLPMFPEITLQQQECVVEQLAAAIAGGAAA